MMKDRIYHLAWIGVSFISALLAIGIIIIGVSLISK